METLPDFNILKDKTIIPPDKCFWIAFWILLVVTVSFLFLKRNIRFGNIWFWIYAKNMTGYSLRIVRETIPPEQLAKTEHEVEQIIQQQNK